MSTRTAAPQETTPRPTAVLRLVAAALVCLSAIALFGFQVRPVGYGLLALGLAVSANVDRALLRDLFLIAVGLVIISTVPLEADLSDAAFLRFSLALGGAVLVPYLLHRFVFRQDVIRFPVRTGRPWTRFEYGYLALVVVLGYLILPVYFIGSGAYLNWPAISSGDQIARLFVGVNAVGLWDELFFICTTFALLRRHFSFWQANVLQATIFVSFLWELGYQSWGPALTIPFALLQGYIFARTKSFTYVLCVHLTFDVIIFGILVHAHNPGLLDIFVTAPG